MPQPPAKTQKRSSLLQIDNFINGTYIPPESASYIDVHSPIDNQLIAKCALSSCKDVDLAVQHAQTAFHEWSKLTVRSRVSILYRFHHLMYQNAEDLAEIIVSECGKNKTEALASVYKGLETIEYACSLPQIIPGKILQVSRNITCHELREPLGVVASIVPFNFPIMVPMWTVPIALALGNCLILKPSEKVPMTMHRVSQLLHQAGIPNGVFQLIHGDKSAVFALCDHSQTCAITFVGSSAVAQSISRRCRAIDKRVLALGGAKNHLIALEDADFESASRDIVASFAGCAGQRCMAASVLILVGDCSQLLHRILERCKELTRGVQQGQVGAIIDHASKNRILDCVNAAIANGAEILMDGRDWCQIPIGNWFGPTVLLMKDTNDVCMQTELFGPVLCVVKVNNLEQALEIENANAYGNAASVYTRNGAFAEYVSTRFKAGMIGINIGIPVPREPFSFGGLYGSKSTFGDCDITGDGCVEFFSQRRKITTKWSDGRSVCQKANFGEM